MNKTEKLSCNIKVALLRIWRQTKETKGSYVYIEPTNKDDFDLYIYTVASMGRSVYFYHEAEESRRHIESYEKLALILRVDGMNKLRAATDENLSDVLDEIKDKVLDEILKSGKTLEQILDYI